MTAPRSDQTESTRSLVGFLARVMLSVTIPIVVVGAVLWWFVADDQLDRTVAARADAVAASVSVDVAPLVVADGESVAVTDEGALALRIASSIVPRDGQVDLRIVDPLGTVVWSSDGGTTGETVAIDGSLRQAFSGTPTGTRIGTVATAGAEPAEPVRYVVPVAVGGRTVAAADVLVRDDRAVAGSVAAGDDLAWLFGGAFAALVIALVPLGWTSLGEVRRNMRRTRTMALNDNLTGLANRTQFHLRLEEAIAGAQRGGSRVGLVLLDLDGFKAINDTGGHAAGDRLLRRVAAGLDEVTRRNEMACRLGGDEFAVVVPRIDDRDELRGLADRLHEKLDLPVSFADGRTLRVTASIGMALYPDDARSTDDLVAVADSSMYKVKQSRKAQLPPALRGQAVR